MPVAAEPPPSQSASPFQFPEGGPVRLTRFVEMPLDVSNARVNGMIQSGVSDRWGAQDFALFLHSPAKMFFLLWNFGVFGRDPQMCTFGLSGCRVKHRRPQTRRCFTRQPESHAHLSATAFKNTTKIQREDPPEREERMKFPAGERKQRAKFWAVRGGAVQQGREREVQQILKTATENREDTHQKS